MIQSKSQKEMELKEEIRKFELAVQVRISFRASLLKEKKTPDILFIYAILCMASGDFYEILSVLKDEILPLLETVQNDTLKSEVYFMIALWYHDSYVHWFRRDPTDVSLPFFYSNASDYYQKALGVTQKSKCHIEQCLTHLQGGDCDSFVKAYKLQRDRLYLLLSDYGVK